ncbi:MAG TPA: alpha/beta hydrolase [Ilumatobacteraceae bacterium]|nr:alpha/beta hydrolase [Ilumatobacteraceae bacterium]
MHEGSFTDTHGIDVFTRTWPVADPKGLVLIAHGASEHSGRYDRFARALNAAGYAAAALDHRGHGNSAAVTGVGRTGPGGGSAVIEDLHQLRTLTSTEVGPETPVFLFGHSLGSLIGLAYLVQHSAGLAGGILCGFPANLADPGGLAEMLAAVDAAGLCDESAAPVLAANNAAFEPARTPYDWLSRDEAEVDAYAADPFCGDDYPITFGYLIDIFGVVGPAAESLGSIACPVLVIAGDKDPAAGMGEFPATLAAALGAAGVSADLTLYPDARHEILNETNRDEVTADTIAWLARHT